MFKGWIVLLLMFLVSIACKAQEFAVINDPDGYVNVRQGKDVKSKIVGKLSEGQIFFYDLEKKNDTWYNVYCSPGNYIHYPEGKAKYPERSEINGYVSASRITPIGSFAHPKLNSNNRRITSNSLTINDDTIALQVTCRKFKPAEHKITNDKYENSHETFVSLIDNKHVYGQDGGMPKIEISGISFTIGRQKIDIPRGAYRNLYEPNLQSWNFYHDKKDNFYIYSLNSDGAGGYFLVFVISKGKFAGRYIDSP